MMASFNAIALLATNKPATSKAAGDVRCSTLCGLKSDVTLSPRRARNGRELRLGPQDRFDL
jgi:hypothetical protein